MLLPAQPNFLPAQHDLTELCRIDADILQSELIVTRQRARVESLERAGNNSALSRSLLKNFKASLELQYAYRSALRQSTH
jgi:hypothetical protein